MQSPWSTNDIVLITCHLSLNHRQMLLRAPTM
jgi:hypothetical protein